VLTHHNSYDGEPIGRILKAQFQEDTKSGRPGLVFTVEITDPDAIEKVLDGRYSTVSIGAHTDKVTCNICGTDRTQEWCEHYPGEEVDGQTTHFIIGNTFGREVSYVNVPADENAGNFSVELQDDENNSSSSKESAHIEMFQVAEGVITNVNNPAVNLYEHLQDDLKNILSNLVINEGSEPSMPTEGQTNPTAPVTEPQIPATAGATNEGATAATPPEGAPAGTTPVTEGANPTPAAPVTTPPAPATTPVQENSAEALQVKINEMQGTITNLVMEKQKFESRLTEADAEVTRLTSENADLLSKLHTSLAEKVVELKRKLNKPDVAGISEADAIASHVTRTKESLDNSLTDLQAELTASRPAPGSVTNPGLSNESEGDENKTYSIEEASSIISSMFSNKKRR
jgi:hypothetical protein